MLPPLTKATSAAAAWIALLTCAPALAQSSAELASLERRFAAARDAYLSQLGEHLPSAYRARFCALSDEDLAAIAGTKRLWQEHDAATPHRIEGTGCR